MKQAIVINPLDNVAVALQDLAEGTVFNGIRIAGPIPAGHKFALKDLSVGDEVIKYGFPIGKLTEDRKAGNLIDHNCLKTGLSGIKEYSYEPHGSIRKAEKRSSGISFKGFRRSDGQVGIRNEIWIIPTVGCINGVVTRLQNTFSAEIAEKRGSVDAVVAFPHNYGCSQLGCDHENTRAILADMVHHPNAGAVLVVGLGCENNQMGAFRELVGKKDCGRVRFMELQKVEGDEIGYGLQQLRELFELCSADRRSDIPVSELKIGLKCGGSDGLSGITANPLLGVFSDWLVGEGGTTVLTEVPEMFGAETILMNRCKDKETFGKTVELINGFKDYFIRNGQPVYENPSPGNKAGGISTLEEKSLGCTQKSGSSQVEDVLPYGARIVSGGLNLLSAPGNDLVASTALAASGCQMVLFTTGRGTPFGTFVPTMKISTNTSLSERKKEWIDFNAGTIAEGGSMSDTFEAFLRKVLDTASGEWTRNELNGYRETAIFKTGVTL